MRRVRRGHAPLGPSGSRRWLTCPPSVIASRGISREESLAAQEGTLAHAVLEACLLLGFSADEVMHYDSHEGADIEEDMLRAVAQAVVYVSSWEANHPDGDIYIEHQVDPGAFIGREDLYGTADIALYDLFCNELVVMDYKHGRKKVVAEENPQLKLYGVGMLLEAVPKPLRRSCKVRLVIVQPRVNKANEEWDTTGGDLLDWMQSYVAHRASLTNDINGERVSGDHCFFCAAAGSCRELTKKVFNVAAMEFGAEDQTPPEARDLSAEEVAYALVHATMLQGWINAVRDHAAGLLLEGHDVPGFTLVYKRLHRKWIDEGLVIGTIAGVIPLDKAAPSTPLAPGKMLKLCKRVKVNTDVVEALQELIVTPDPEITVAPVGDSRKAYTHGDEELE